MSHAAQGQSESGKWADYRERAKTAGREFLEAVDRIVPAIASRRAESDRLNMVTHASVQDMVSAGVFRAMAPLQHGGLEMDPASFFEGIMRLAAADPSASWIGGQLTVHCFEIALMDPKFQEEFWSTGPDTRASSAFAPVGNYRKVDGGYVLDGTWVFSSGVDHASWVILGGKERNFLVPRSDLTIVPDSWDVQGLRGTGSKSVTAKEVFVPEYRTHDLMDVFHDKNAGWQVNDRPFYRMSWLAIQNATMPNSAIGLTTGSLNQFVEQTKVRLAKMGTGVPVAENPHMHARLASALTQTRRVRDRHLDNWRQVFDLACRGERPSQLDTLRMRYEAVDAAGTCFDTFTEIWPFAGATVIDSRNPLSHSFRDLMAMRNHGSAAREGAATMYMKALFELPLPPVSNLNTLAYYR